MDSWVFTLVAFVCSLHSLFALKSQGVCFLPVDEGPCRTYISRFYYNTRTQQCEEFSYGGCQGNENNFLSYQECRQSCFRIPKIPLRCRLPMAVGPCRALHQKYFFNMTTMQCEIFHYGGCYGNENRFPNLASCKDSCSSATQKSIHVLCFAPLDKGTKTCSASIIRYYYNTNTKMCEEFIYSGCGGSNNNFVNKQSCIDTCAKVSERKKNFSENNFQKIQRSKKYRAYSRG